MTYKILEAEGVENENIDGAAFNNFISRGLDGRMKGVLNECSVYKSTSNLVTMDTGELLIHGFRVKILSPYTVERTASASTLSHSIVAKITLNSDRTVAFALDCRTSVSSLVQDSLFSAESGVYEVIVATFTTDSTGIVDVTYTLPIIGQPDILTEEYISDLVSRVWEFVREQEHPIHSIHISVDSTDPAELYGGYWVKLKDAFLWCSGDTTELQYTNLSGNWVTESLLPGNRGGESYHKLLIIEMPSHNHRPIGWNVQSTGYVEGSTSYALYSSQTYDNWEGQTTYTGGTMPHNNMPPYFAVNAWYRVTEDEFNESI